MSARAARSRGRRVATALGVLLVCLLAAELGLRLVHNLRPSFVFAAGELARFRGRPHAPNYDGRLNARGFNDTEFAVPKPNGLYRIAALGDSFVFGVVPYGDNFLTLLEGRLAAEGRPVELLNLGIPSTAPEDHALLLSSEGLDLEPDAVLQFVYVGNDLTTMPLARRTHWRPYLLDLGRFLFGILPRIEGRVFHGRRYRDERPNFDEQGYLDVVRPHLAVFDPGWPAFAERVERLRRVVARTRELCRRHGVRLAVVLLPAEVQVDGELLRQAAGPGRARELDVERPNRELARLFAADGLPCLDLLPALAAAARGERLYKPRDSHWNLAGNRLAAELLYAWLTSGAAGFELPPPAESG